MPFELSVDLTTLAILAFVAFIAGFIDAIAGGGGLLTTPALLTAGMPPHLVLGTNTIHKLPQLRTLQHTIDEITFSIDTYPPHSQPGTERKVMTRA